MIDKDIRHKIQNKNLTISYFDTHTENTPLLFLHGHCSCANTFVQVAEAFKSRYRIIRMDQRGHGWSGHSADYSREAYIDDIRCLVEMLGLRDVILVGHSLGGVNAYQFSARYPQYVKALVVEDIGTRVNADMSLLLPWPRRFASIRDLRNHFRKNKLGDNTFFMESIVEYEDGWGFRFDYEDIFRSQQLLNGNHAADWEKVVCPVLLMHGERSWALSKENALEMSIGKPNVTLVEFPLCSHVIHDEHPQQYINEMEKFLAGLA